MLALPIALLLALPVGETAPVDVAALEPTLVPPALIPSGTASGTWVAGTTSQAGVLVALLVDDLGRPLFVLDSMLTAQGALYGELRPLEYATNPALGLPHLYIVGEAELPTGRPGSFWAVISSPLDRSKKPVAPFGWIEGALILGLDPVIKPAGGIQLQASAVQVTRPGVRLAHEIQVAQGSELLAAVSHSGLPVASVGAQSTAIFCPYAPGVSSAQLGSESAAIADGEVPAFLSVTNVGLPVASVGAQSTAIVCPHAPGYSSGQSGAAGAASANGELPAGLSVVLHQGAGFQQYGQGLQPAQTVVAEGKVRATWYLKP